MKRYILLFIVISFIVSCSTTGGTNSGGDGSGNGGDKSSGKTNPLCTTTSKIAKMKITEDGLYRLTYSDLYNACLDLFDVDISLLKMTNRGEEIAIDVIDNNSNDILDEGDYIDFYGMAILRSDDRFRYTETNVYWLSIEEGTRKRIERITSNPLTNQPFSSFLKTLHMEEDTYYVQGITNYPSLQEHWFWGDVFSTPGSACENLVLEQCKTHPEQRYYFERDYNFSTPHIDENQQVSLKIRLQAVSGSHHLRVYLNNPTSPVYDKTWSEQTPFEIEITVLSSYLNSIGTNTLTLESVGDTEFGIFDFFYLDWFEVSYYHTYQAEHDVLEFTGKDLIEVTDFSSENIHVYAISNHNSVQKVVPQEIGWTLSTGYKVRFSGSQDTEGKFIAVTDEEKKSPFSVDAFTPSGLRTKSANYIIITHEDFYDSIKPLADYRAGQDHNVLTVNIGEVYNEFSYGIETPQAIKDFLAYAYNNNWSTKYVLLVGDATLDYKDVSGYGKSQGIKSYIPAYLYNYTGLGEVPTDNWFVDVDEANGILPEMSIGRIPAKDAEDVIAVVNKIMAHENTSNPLSDKILLIADDIRDETKNENPLPLAPEGEQIFEGLSNKIAEMIPAYSYTKLYQSDYYPDDAGFRAAILSELNSGPLILNYTGHGSVDKWTKEPVFSSEDIVLLQNKSYPFVVTLNCLNGYFVLPDDNIVLNNNKQYPSIAEAFLLAPEKGALAVFAASAIGYASEHDSLAEALYNEIFKEKGVTVLGDAVLRAKEVFSTGKSEDEYKDVVQTFIFFGDPATRLK